MEEVVAELVAYSMTDIATTGPQPAQASEARHRRTMHSNPTVVADSGQRSICKLSPDSDESDDWLR
jgi:hypothetical protein